VSVQPADEPPDDRAAGWRPHPQHPTVQRYWDGTAWTAEHRFAPLEPVDDLPAPRLEADVAVASRVAQYTRDAIRGASGGAWLGAAFGIPWIHLGTSYLLAASVDDCSEQPQAAWVLGLGAAMWLASVAAAERGMRLLDVRMWVRVLVVTFAGLYSAAFVYTGLVLVAMAAFCFGC
jgi:hypothetical protein